jgi:hypothetical protein
MVSLHALAAPLVLILPLMGQGVSLPVAATGSSLEAGAAIAGEAAPQCDADPDAVHSDGELASPIEMLHREQVVGQVRIEQRIVIRISPQRNSNRNSLFASLPQQPLNTRYEERKMSKCISVAQIAGVQTGSGTQLLLYLTDRTIVSANLEKACRARDFYSGFYVERSQDGKLCVGRDKLQSRTGATCEVARMRQLVAVSK